MRKMTKRAAVIGTSAVLAVAGGTAAFAYATGWFHGDGTAAATTSTIQNVHASFTVAGNLYPGKIIDVNNAHVSNPNDYTVQITGVSVASVVDPGGAGCTQSKAGFTFDSLPAGTTVANGTTAENVNLGHMTMSQTADPVCAGRALTVNLTLAGEIAS